LNGFISVNELHAKELLILCIHLDYKKKEVT
jgi:hypothetical protein